MIKQNEGVVLILKSDTSGWERKGRVNDILALAFGENPQGSSQTVTFVPPIDISYP